MVSKITTHIYYKKNARVFFMFPIGSETIKRRKIKFPIVIKKSVEMVIGVLVSEKNFDLLNKKPLKFR